MGGTMKVKVLEVRLVNGDKPLKAFVDILIDDTIIREFRVIKHNGKRFLVAAPQCSWKAPDGSIQYKTLITLPDEAKGLVDLEVLRAFNLELEKTNAERSK